MKVFTIDNLKVAIGTELNKVLAALAPTIDKITSGLISGFGKGRKVLVDVINYFIDLYNESTIFRASIQLIKVGFINMWNGVKLIFNQIIDRFRNIGQLIKAVFTGDFKAIPKIIKDSFKDTVDAFGFKGTWKFFGKHWRFGMDEYRGAFSKTYFLNRLRKLNTGIYE